MPQKLFRLKCLNFYLILKRFNTYLLLQFSFRVTGQNWTMVDTFGKKKKKKNYVTGFFARYFRIMLKKPDREDRGLNKRDFYDGLNAGRKRLWSSSLTDTLSHTRARAHIHTAHPPSRSFTRSHCAMHSSILLYLGLRRRLGRRTKANWNAPVSAFLTWRMAREMQLGPAATLASVCQHGAARKNLATLLPCSVNTFSFLKFGYFWFEIRESNAAQKNKV